VNRGVDVTLVTSRKADTRMIHHAQQSYFEELLSAGVRVLRYPFPDILHSKFILVDDDILTIASSNMDMRSFSQDCDVPLMDTDLEVVWDAVGVPVGYVAVPDRLDLHDWRARWWHEKYRDNVIRCMSGVL